MCNPNEANHEPNTQRNMQVISDLSTTCPVCSESRHVMVTMECGHGCCAHCMIQWYIQCRRMHKTALCMTCRALPKTLLMCFGNLFDDVSKSVIQINNILHKNASTPNAAIDLTDDCKSMSEWANQVALI